MENKVQKIVIVVLTIVIIYIFYYEDLSNKSQDYDFKYEFYREKEIINNEILTIYSDISECALTNELNKKQNFKSISNNNTLYYKFSQKSCMACVSNDINILKKIHSKSKDIDIVVLTDYDNSKYIKIFKLEHSIPFHVYKLENKLNLPIEYDKKKIPFFFTLSSDCIVTSIFASRPENKASDAYFVRIKHIIKNSKKYKQ